MQENCDIMIHISKSFIIADIFTVLNLLKIKMYCLLFLGFLQVEVMYEDEPLKDYYTLMDIAYIYTWRRVRDLFGQNKLDFS